MIKNHKNHSPLPWSYHNKKSLICSAARRDWIEDANGNVIVSGLGRIDGPLIVECVNTRISPECGEVSDIVKGPEPFFPCQNTLCAEEGSWHEDDLRLMEGEPICQGCFNQDHYQQEETDSMWIELPPFIPEFKTTIQQQKSQIERLNNVDVDRAAALESDLYKFVDFINETYSPDTAGPEGWGEYQQGIIELAKELNDCRINPKPSKDLSDVLAEALKDAGVKP